MQSPYNPGIVLLRYFSDRNNTFHPKTCTQMFISALFIIVSKWKQRYPSIGECLLKKKKTAVHIYYWTPYWVIQRNELIARARKSWRFPKEVLSLHKYEYKRPISVKKALLLDGSS